MCEEPNGRLTTGLPGFDEILHGGLIPHRAYLVRGAAGTGKTTLGFHFLAARDTPDDRKLFISLGEPQAQICQNAAALGFDLGGVPFLDLSPTAEAFAKVQTYDIFSPAEVEREPISLRISKTIEERRPKRIFVDSFGYFLNLASDPFQRRRLAQSFFRFATKRGATLIVAAEERDCARDADGVIHLQASPEGRSIQITKFRGSDFLAGQHPMCLTSEGLQVPLTAA